MKKGNTTLGEWHQKLCGQLTELFCRPPNRPNVDNYFSRRIILLTSGVPQSGVLVAINNWNQKLPLPIELVDGLQFTRMLIDRGYNMTNVSELIKKPDEMSDGE
jgi:hypothetical protein